MILRRAVPFLVSVAMLLSLPAGAAAQAEVTAWGNLEGIRVEGHLFDFETGVCLNRPDGSELNRSSKERQRPRYSRDGSIRTVESALNGVSFRQEVEDAAEGVARVNIVARADTQEVAARTVYCFDLPLQPFADGSAVWLESDAGRVALADVSGRASDAASVNASGVRFEAGGRQLEVRFDRALPLAIGRSGRGGGAVRLEAPLLPAGPARGDSGRLGIELRVSGEVDREPVQVVVDARRPGRWWEGMGGNFRLQNAADSVVIDYNLGNMRVVWGRIEMPWQHWHPEEAVSPLEEARAGRIHPRVAAAMEMARELAARGMPVAVGVWFPPTWAIVDGEGLTTAPPGPPGAALDSTKLGRIHESIADFLVFMKEAYGVEAVLFSFNESDIGVDVRQTAEEHARLNRELGAYFGTRGLATRMLLGDTSDATALEFLGASLADADALRWVGAVSYHSWRGWDDATLRAWGDVAADLNVPLLVGEGSTDAGAWRYPAIFQEPAFALEEIELYVRMLSLSQPLSILQWQLTADYSLLAGGGVRGDDSPLRPTQRFWNLKQLADAPAGFHLPTTCESPAVACAAVGDRARGHHTVHLVNGGAQREARLEGLPNELTRLRVYVTDAARGMVELDSVPVSGGRASVTMPPTSYLTLTAD